jgi:hypothetical protein
MNQGDHINQSDNQDNSRDPVNKTGFVATAAIFIGWYLSVSTNGVFNFFNDSLGFQLYPFCFALWSGVILVTFQLVLRHKNIPWMFMVAAIMCVAVFVVTSDAVERKYAARVPNCNICIHSEFAPAGHICLTNKEVLYAATNWYPENPYPALVSIDVPTNATNCSVVFTIENVSGAIAEDVSMSVQISPSVQHSFPGWPKDSRVYRIALERYTCLVPFRITPGNTAQMPPLEFGIPNAPNYAFPISLMLRVTGSPPKFIGFWLGFRQTRASLPDNTISGTNHIMIIYPRHN